MKTKGGLKVLKGLCLVVLMLLSILLPFWPEKAYAKDLPSSERDRRRLIAMRECLSDEHLDTDDGVDDFGDLFHDGGNAASGHYSGEYIVVGFDLDAPEKGGNGVWSCKTAFKAGMSVLDPSFQGSSDDKIQNLITKKLTGKDDFSTGTGTDAIKQNRDKWIGEIDQAVQKYLPVKESYKALRFQPLINTCYEKKRSGGEPLTDRDFSVTKDGRTDYYYYKGFDDDSIPWLRQRGHGEHVELGDINLGFFSSGISTGASEGDFDSWDSDFFPFGFDFTSDINGLGDYSRRGIVDCEFVKKNEDLIKKYIQVTEEESDSATFVDEDGDSLTAPSKGEFEGTGTAGASCESSQGGLGWIVCGVATWFLNRLEELVGEVSEDLLFVRINDDPSGGLYQAWRSFTTIANIFFVIGFMFVIFAQATSIGIDAYTLKKMLPRIVIGVIAVQLSFFLIKIGVDISNVLGRGVEGLMSSATGGTAALQGSLFGSGFLASLGSLITAGILIYVFIITLPTILLGLLAVYFTLVIRLAIIAVLIVIAPIAMVAWILPNTEFLFRKWSSTFMKVLLMFPLIILLLASGKLAGSLLINDSVGSLSDANVVGPLTAIASLVLNAAPYFLIPFTFAFASKGIAALGNAVTNFGNKTIRNKEGALRGSPGARLNQFRQRTAAGANWAGRSQLGRRLAAPTTFIPGIGRRRERRLAVAGVANAAKEMQDMNIDGETAMAIGMSGGFEGQYAEDGSVRGTGEFGAYVEELREHGMHDMARRLIASRNDPANRRWRDNVAGQQAALLVAAQKGYINGNMLRSVEDGTGHVGWTGADRTAMTSQLVGAAHARGRYDVVAGNDPAQLASLVNRLGTDELKKTHRDAAEGVSNALLANLTSGNVERQTQAAFQLGDLMHQRSGIDPEMRRRLEQEVANMESLSASPDQQALAKDVRERIRIVQEGYLPDDKKRTTEDTTLPPAPPGPAPSIT